ncbi:MAG: hypothetical protein MJZ33_10810 [Paludibacteraceae bacterium]|nr:hypothetical protein [Paludibacteraceae bacterium]
MSRRHAHMGFHRKLEPDGHIAALIVDVHLIQDVRQLHFKRFLPYVVDMRPLPAGKILLVEDLIVIDSPLVVHIAVHNPVPELFLDAAPRRMVVLAIDTVVIRLAVERHVTRP